MQAVVRMLDGVPWDQLVAALLHSLWQAAALAALVWVVLRRVTAARANLRYGVALLGLGGALVGPMATFHVLRHGPERSTPGPVAVAGEDALVIPGDEHSRVAASEPAPPAFRGHDEDAASSATNQPPPGFTSAYRWAAALWLAGTSLMLARAAWLLVGAGRLWRGCHPLHDHRLTAVVNQLRRSMRIARPVRLATGPGVRVPAVLGLLAPVVLLPASVVGGVPVEQLRMVLAHELAHVRRHDYLVNLLQLLVEAVLFFNPAVWWLSRQVRAEREACCDALAVAATGAGGAAYARSLADVLAALVDVTQPGLQLTPAVNSGGTMLDRVKRLLAPAHQPDVRVPWYSLIAAAVVAAGVLAGTWRGTEVVVLAAEQLVSPQERVERIAELQREIVPAGAARDAAGETAKATLAGVVRTDDGGPIPPGTNVTAYARSGNSHAAYSLDLDPAGRFSKKVDAGRAQVSVEAPGYAPGISEPVRVGTDGSYPPVELVLDRGFDARLKLVGRDGQPVEGGRVRVSYERPPVDGRDWLAAGAFASDGAGVVVVPHARRGAAQVTVDLPSYEYDQVVTSLEPGKVAEVRLTPAKRTTGLIVDARTGNPIAGATVTMVSRAGFADQTWYPRGRWDRPPVLSRTEADGRFWLDRLRADSAYAVLLTAPGYGCALLQGVRAGQDGLRWALNPPRRVTLRVLAEPGAMPRQVSVSNPLVLDGNSSYDSQFDLPVEVKEDGAGVAVLEDPLPGSVRFYANDRQARIDLASAEPAAPTLVLDLRQPPAGAATTKPATREVVVKLDWPKDGPAPRGRLRVDHIRPDSRNSYWPDEVELRDGEARVTVPVPTQLGYSQGELLGYWIDDQHGIDVPPGDGPLVVRVPAEPAGALHGTVGGADGRPFAESFYVSLYTVTRAPGSPGGRQPPSLQPYNGHDGSGRFLLSPIALGGTYRLVAMAGARAAVSEPIVVDARQPIRAVDLRFAEGVTLPGRVVTGGGGGGEAVGGAKVELSFRPRGADGTHTTSATADRDGRFAFPHVDPAAGSYALHVRPGPRTHGLVLRDVAVTPAPLEVRVGPGLSVRGRVLDVDANGKGIANVRVVLQAADAASAKYPYGVEALADADGNFTATGLEPIAYLVVAQDTYSPGATFVRDAAGRAISVRTSGSEPIGPTVTGGQAAPVDVPRRRSPWR